MREAKCPDCRKRFSFESDSVECARCGADLSLLKKIGQHADRLAVEALFGSAMESGEQVERLKKVQHICQSPEVELLIRSLAKTAPPPLLDL